MEKEKIRNALPTSNLLPEQYGKLAEQIRKMSAYRKAKRVFISPASILWQARINALLDQKELLLPSGGLKKGFFLFKPNTIAFNQLGHALTFKGMDKFGKLVRSEALPELPIDLFITGSEAVDLHGGRVGEGLGFSDLAAAILAEYGALRDDVFFLCAAADNRILDTKIPSEIWDIAVDACVSPTKVELFAEQEKRRLQIYWDILPKKKRRKIQPLWDLYCKNNPK